jgi:TldD protein
VKKHPRKVALDEKKNLCMRQCNVAQHFDKRMVNVKSTFGEYYGFIYHINTDGTEVSYELLLVGLGISCIAKENSVLVDARASYGGTYGLEVFKKKEHTPENLGENAAKWAIEKLKAKPAPAGRFPAVINQRLCGVLAHESFGHMSEGDSVVIGMSPLTGKIGQQLGSTNVTIVDEGLPKNGGYKIFFDDEGVPCKRVERMKNGVLRSYLHSRMTAHMLRAEPTGNARSQDHTYEPIVRMRNTFFEAGDWKLEEALEGLKSGIYAIDSAGGQASLDGTFLFKAVRGYWIENGEIKYPLRDVALTENILELLKNVDAVCNDLEIRSTPFGGCGKIDQRAFVGLGGPHIRIKDVLFGEMSK